MISFFLSKILLLFLFFTAGCAEIYGPFTSPIESSKEIVPESSLNSSTAPPQKLSGKNGQQQLNPESIQNSNPVRVLNEWGQRSSHCQQASDWWDLKVPLTEEDLPGFGRVSFSELDHPVAMSSTAAKNNCYRVGGEIKIWRSGEEPKRLLARALVTEIIFSQKETAQVRYDILESFPRQSLETAGDRVANCDQRFFDRKNFNISREQEETLFPKIRDGVVTASIWAGARNCFRVGSQIKVLFKSENNKDKNHGFLTVKKVEMLPFVELSAEVIASSGEIQIQLRERLGEKLDKYHGFASVVHFEYLDSE